MPNGCLVGNMQQLGQARELELIWMTLKDCVGGWVNSKHQQLIHPVLGCTLLDSSWLWIQTSVSPSFSFCSITLWMRAGYMCRMPKIFLAYTMFGINILYNCLIFYSVKEKRDLSCLIWNSAWISYLWNCLVFFEVVMFFSTTAEVAFVTFS